MRAQALLPGATVREHEEVETDLDTSLFHERGSCSFMDSKHSLYIYNDFLCTTTSVFSAFNRMLVHRHCEEGVS